MNLLIILESFFSFFSQFYDFGQERNHLNHQYISNKGVLIVVLPPRFFSLISTYHTIESFKEKRTFLGGFSFFFFAWKALEQPQKSLSLVCGRIIWSFEEIVIFAVFIKKCFSELNQWHFVSILS